MQASYLTSTALGDAPLRGITPLKSGSSQSEAVPSLPRPSPNSRPCAIPGCPGLVGRSVIHTSCRACLGWAHDPLSCQKYLGLARTAFFEQKRFFREWASDANHVMPPIRAHRRHILAPAPPQVPAMVEETPPQLAWDPVTAHVDPVPDMVQDADLGQVFVSYDTPDPVCQDQFADAEPLGEVALSAEESGLLGWWDPPRPTVNTVPTTFRRAMSAAGSILGMDYLSPENVQIDPAQDFAATGRPRPPPRERKIEVPLPEHFLTKLDGLLTSYEGADALLKPASLNPPNHLKGLFRVENESFKRACRIVPLPRDTANTVGLYGSLGENKTVKPSADDQILHNVWGQLSRMASYLEVFATAAKISRTPPQTWLETFWECRPRAVPGQS